MGAFGGLQSGRTNHPYAGAEKAWKTSPTPFPAGALIRLQFEWPVWQQCYTGFCLL